MNIQLVPPVPDIYPGSPFRHVVRVLMLAILLCWQLGPRVAYAAPAGGQVVAGAASIQQSGATLNIHQTSDRAIINWQNFSIGAGETAKFLQPGPGSATLNRVLSGNPSSLLGRLEANGSVFLINPNGILVGGGAVINTHSFIASTLDLTDSQFMSGANLNFLGDSKAGIQNLGVIRASGGDVFLIAHSVENAGLIEAVGGVAGLAAGNDVLLQRAGDQRLFIRTTAAATAPTETGVKNAGLIAAAQAELKAAGGNVYSLAVNNGGVIQASGIVEKDGRVMLTSAGGTVAHTGVISAQNADGSGGTVLVGGDYQGANPEVANARRTFVGEQASINVSAGATGNGGKAIVWADEFSIFNGSISARGGVLGGDGGLVETSGKLQLSLGPLATANASAAAGRPGLWLLDPTDITVIASPTVGNLDGSAPNFTPTANANTISGGTIAAALDAGTDVTLNTASAFAGSGNIIFDGAIVPTLSTATLRAIADGDITVNGQIGAASTADQFVLNFQADNVFINNGAAINARSMTLSARSGAVDMGGQVAATGTGVHGDLLITATGIIRNSPSGNLSANRLVMNSNLEVLSSGVLTANELAGFTLFGNFDIAGTARIGTLKNISSARNMFFYSANGPGLTIDGNISVAAGRTVSITTGGSGPINFLTGATIATDPTGTTRLSANGQITGTPLNTSPVVVGGGGLSLAASTDVGTSVASPLYTSVGRLDAATTFGGVFIHNDRTLNIGRSSSATGNDPNTSILGVQVNLTTGGEINIVNDGSIFLTSSLGERVTGRGNVTLRAVGTFADITVANFNADGVRSHSGVVTLDAGQNIILGTVSPVAPGNVLGFAGVNLLAGLDVRMDSASSITGKGAGSVNITANSIFLDQNGGSGARISTEGGNISLTSRPGFGISLDSGSGSRVFTTAGAGAPGNITFKGDDLIINSGINAGTANVKLMQANPAVPIDLGATGSSVGKLNLSSPELDFITANDLRIGDLAFAGNITVSAPVLGFIKVNSLSLKTAGDVAFNNWLIVDGSDGIGRLDVEAQGDITGQLGSIISAAGVTFLAGGDVRLDGATTLTATDSGNVNITANSIFLAQSGGAGAYILAQGGSISLNSRPGFGISLDSGSANGLFTTAGAGAPGSIFLKGDDLVINSAINAGTANVRLSQASANQPIDIGATGSSAGQLNLSAAELDLITANDLSIGNYSLAGNITVSAPAQALTKINSLSIQTAGAVAFNVPLQVSGSGTVASRIEVDAMGNITSAVDSILSASILDLDSDGGFVSLSGQLLTSRLLGEAANYFSAGGLANSISELGNITTGGGMIIVASSAGDLTVNGLLNGGIIGIRNSAGNSETPAGNLTLAPGARVTGSQLQLISDGGFFINQAGPTALNASSRFTVYSRNNSAPHDKGGLSGVDHFGVSLSDSNTDPLSPQNVFYFFQSAPSSGGSSGGGSGGGGGSDGGGQTARRLLSVTEPTTLPTPRAVRAYTGPDKPIDLTTFRWPSKAEQDSAFNAKSWIKAQLFDGAESRKGFSDRALDGILAAAGAALAAGQNYHITTPAQFAPDDARIVASRPDSSGTVKVVFNDGKTVEVPVGGSVVTAGLDRIQVLGPVGASGRAMIFGSGQGTLVYTGSAVVSKSFTEGGATIETDNDLGGVYRAINNNWETKFADNGLKLVTLKNGNSVLVAQPSTGMESGLGLKIASAYTTGLGGRGNYERIIAMANASGLSPDDVGSIVAGGGGNVTPGVIAAIVAGGGGNMTAQQVKSLVQAAGGKLVNGNIPPNTMVAILQAGIVAGGGGNLIGQDGAGIVAGGGGNIVAGGGGNIVAGGGGNIVAGGGGNFGYNTVASIVAGGGGNLSVKDYASLIGQGGSTLIGQGGSTLIAAGIVAGGVGNLIGIDGASLRNSIAALIDGNAASFSASIIDMAKMVAGGGGNLIGLDAASIVAGGGGNFVKGGGSGIVAVGDLNLRSP